MPEDRLVCEMWAGPRTRSCSLGVERASRQHDRQLQQAVAKVCLALSFARCRAVVGWQTLVVQQRLDHVQ